MKFEKKAYRRPQLVEYGRLAEVTQGFGGHKQDNGWFNNNSTACRHSRCDVPEPPAPSPPGG